MRTCSNIDPNYLRFLLQKCMKLKVLQPGKQIHAQLLVTGRDMEMGSLNSNIVGMYTAGRDMISSRSVFANMDRPTAFVWNWLISASAFHGDSEGAIQLFIHMQKGGVSANKFTFSCILKACVGLLDIKKGEELHCIIIRRGLECETMVGNALIDMYCKCGDLFSARRLFDKMLMRDVASWTCMICGYSQIKKLEESCILFEQMKSEGLEPNEFTWNAMIAGHAHNGDFRKASDLLLRMNEGGLIPDVVTWNAMISGFSQNHQSLKAIELFHSMLEKGVKPNSVTFVALLPAYGSISSLERGRWIHGLIYRWGSRLNVFTGSALIDMYSKCGSVQDARKVFDCVLERNTAVWNTMIGCYGKHGFVEDSIDLFERMLEEGFKPNQVTFTCLLSACSHGGFVDKGLEIFQSIKETYGVEYTREHYSCMVDALSRSGKIEDTYKLIMEIIPKEVNDSILGAFLNGCKMHARGDMARRLVEDLNKMDLDRPGGLVTLSNIYAANEEWEKVANVRRLMKEKKVSKRPGCSWLERKNEFTQ
ncbi:pentatricopeptide repeat-containing protein At1g11290, chloroplastic-like [Aristolochia californica]|uniref:pentatricopeptide repeat-containing protein At1g11290, chloroplastic-like n=1 Tax=Aristolochia californica TaxID=171875 RepID=UPI0035D95943